MTYLDSGPFSRPGRVVVRILSLELDDRLEHAPEKYCDSMCEFVSFCGNNITRNLLGNAQFCGRPLALVRCMVPSRIL